MTVSQLNRAVSGVLDRGFPLVWVRGEIANFTRATSGHWYFTLKDSSAQVRCVMFRGRNQLVGFNPREGDEIEARCNVGLYEPRGDFQLNVEFVRRSGQGRLFEEFLRLKNRLQAEGLFDPEGRRDLPRLPSRIGIVTSPQAAALRDVLATLARRAPYATLVLYPVPVQGAGAGERIASMLATASQRAEVEVLLLVRGGGSIEDLWAFNEEAVARAIRASRVPVVVGVGHESDVTIADFAADLRAPTPTAAAELVAPAVEDLLATVSTLAARARRVLRHRLQAAAQRLDYAARALQTPRAPIAALEARVAGLQARAVGALERSFGQGRLRLARLRGELDRARPRASSVRLQPLAGRMAAAAWQGYNGRARRLDSLAGRLTALDPQAVLARGYSIALDAEGRAVTDSARLACGDALHVVFASGAAETRVEAIQTTSGES